ncbi:putative lipid II flippase FtsW [Candidatus Poribacteria bacterium]|nr:putative lipid II flippase FtsW [Candidatus Poribacteria bacterium]
MRLSKPSENWVDEGARQSFRAARETLAEERAPRLRQARLPLWLQVDPFLAFCIVSLTAIGLVMVYSSSAAMSADRAGSTINYFRIQLIAAALGAIGGVVAMRVPMTFFSRNAKPILLASLIGLILVFVPGISSSKGGFHRWIRLFIFPFQPVEIAKIALIIYVARFLSSGNKSVRSLFQGVLPNVIVMLVVVGLLILQPDFGSAVLICAVVFTMLLAGGARVSHVVLLGILAAIPAYLLIVSDSYRFQRVTSFVKWIGGTAPTPDDKGYQIWQSYNALSAGGLWGTGLGEGIYKLFYLPAPHTDFIFAVIGEELGFIGGAAVIALFAALATRGVMISYRVRDPFMQMLAFGVTILLCLQAIVNIGMVLGLLPTKGFTLPFISYGGSSLMMTLIAAGMLLNVSRYAQPDEAER